MIELFDIWWKWKWQIAIVCILAILTSIIVTLPVIMPPYYASKAEFYPANPSAIDRNTLFSTERENYVAYFGSTDDIDRIISLARSSGLASYIIEKYKLLDVYDIDTTKVKEWKYTVRKEFDDKYSSSKTDRNSIEINILDTDPNRASDMVKDIVTWLDARNMGMIQENKNKTLEELQEKIDAKTAEIEVLSDSATKLSGVKALLIKQRQEGLTEEINNLQKIHSQFEISASNKFSSIYMIENPSPADKKAKPVRWMIVLGTAVISFVALSILAVILELFKKEKTTHA
ncbi:MAG: hypothetical protein K1X55_01395 [Chitinophagales bacterium]|nr:hypothetical protein [Chitinophagales bacterium]